MSSARIWNTGTIRLSFISFPFWDGCGVCVLARCPASTLSDILELADIVRAFGEVYRQRYGARLLPSHVRALGDIEACRTAALGGHVQACDHCGARQYSYHSCRNRHCPKCHREQTQRWLEHQRARLPPCAYFLVTFTLPAELRALARAHQKRVYGLLMRAAAAALLKLTTDPRYLGARPWLLAVLHTWTRALLYHPRN